MPVLHDEARYPWPWGCAKNCQGGPLFATEADATAHEARCKEAEVRNPETPGKKDESSRGSKA